MYYDTIIPELMTWEEKAENDAQGGIKFPSIGLPGLPDLDLEGLAAALEQIIGNIGNLDLSVLTGLLGTLGGIVGSLGDLLGGLLGGGGGTPAPAPTPEDSGDGSGDTTPETPSTDTPSTDTPTQTPSHVGSSSVNRTQTTTGLVLDGEPHFSVGNSTWVILFVIAAVIAGILVIKL